MAQEYIAIDVSEVPELARLAEAVQKTGKPHALKRGEETIAVVRPQPRRSAGRRAPRRRSGILEADDSLFELAGIGESTGPGDVSANKHKYLADALDAEAQH